MSSLLHNDLGGITHVIELRPGLPENRSEILADLRMTLDALGETCEHHQKARENIDKLLAMLQPGEATDALRDRLNADMEKLDALAKFNNYILERVRGGTFKRFAELFDQ